MSFWALKLLIGLDYWIFAFIWVVPTLLAGIGLFFRNWVYPLDFYTRLFSTRNLLGFLFNFNSRSLLDLLVLAFSLLISLCSIYPISLGG